MVLCEFFFKEFHSRGSDDYVYVWSSEVDKMAAQGWTVIECCRQSEHPGFWTVVLGRPAQQFCCPERKNDLAQDWE
jgi:hypothetical protein